MRRRLSHADVVASRRTPGRSLLLFLTDRCPVGCGHCSVDSRPDSPTISDWPLFEDLVEAVARRDSLEVVGISGGEPFVERRGLTYATAGLAAAGKQVVPYTSGVWAKRAAPAWVRDVLRQSSCVYLSTDAFHEDRVPGACFVRAATAVVEEGAGLVVQVLGVAGMVERATALLIAAFGEAWSDVAELNVSSPLPQGRGAVVFGRRPGRAGDQFAPCGLLGSPVVRYDGVVSACCNEGVIMGAGPPRLRRGCATRADVAEALDRFAGDELLAVMAGPGPAALTALPGFTDLADRRFSTVCDLCWEANRRAESSPPNVRLLAAVAAAIPAGAR